jgi:photosystem II stability/assembly factor-like uncharacterized protein
MTAIAVHPTAMGTVYAGAADGGVWKTTNGGTSWVPLTDSIADLSVGALALAPSSPNIIYLGTGEGGSAGDFVPGIGLLKSTDGGATWGFPASVVATRFNRISVHPTNPQELVIGTNEGGFRSTDGGANWTSVISKNQYGDVTDLVRDPSNPQILYAGTWDEDAACAFFGCGVLSSRVLKSTDGGVSWTEKSSGLALSTLDIRVFSKVSIAISPSNPLVLYAAMVSSPSSPFDERSHIYKTTDGGNSWTELTGLQSNSGFAHYLDEQGSYDNTLVVSPSNENSVLAAGVSRVASTDGGATWASWPGAGDFPHVDHHDLQYQGSTLYIATDGGVWTSPDGGRTTVGMNAGLVTRQYYSIANDPAHRNRVLAGSQDNGWERRPDEGGTVWTDQLFDGDGFAVAVNQSVPSIAYLVALGGLIERTRDVNGPALRPDLPGVPIYTNVTPPYPLQDGGGFFSVLALDPSNPGTLYIGTQYSLWRSTDGGDSWQDFPVPTNLDTTNFGPSNIYAIAVARSNGSLMVVKNLQYGARTLDTLCRSTDGGSSWVQASAGLPNAFVTSVEIDPRSPNIAYAAIGGQSGDHVYQTVNGGASWSARSAGLPGFSAHVVRVDPADSNVLYCGTDVGVFRSTDQGISWSRFGTGLPASSVNDMQILDDDSAMRIGTHGRGIWELQIPATGNTPPSATISAPASAQTIVRGASLSFSGVVSDPDSGDTITGTWIFPDTWQTQATGAGPTTASHTFNRSGIFPVTLTARDNHGAVGSASITVNVVEPADNCSTPTVVPGSGPFPWSLTMSNETGSRQTSDPLPACAVAANGTSGSLWFEFTPTVAGSYEFSTCGAAVDTVLSLWTGAACGPYTPIEGQCDRAAPFQTGGPICGFRGISSSLTLQASAGQTLRLLVGRLYPDPRYAGVFTLTVGLAGGHCADIQGQNPLSFPAQGGQGQISVTAPQGCGWSATPNAGFLTVTSGASGSGPGTVAYSVVANTGDFRNGTITIGGRTLSVYQVAGTSGPGAPVIVGAALSGKNLIVNGRGFDNGAVVILNGADQRTSNDDQNPTTTLIARKTGKKIPPGQQVALQVMDSSGALSNQFNFTR